MKNLLLTLLHLAVIMARLCGPGGVRAVIAENLVLKQQLIVLRRRRQRAPNLTLSDRLLCGFGSLFLHPGRIRKLAIAIRPSTLLAFHQALVRGKYRRLFSSRPCPKKPGPKGPDEALIRVIVDLKSRNPRFGCPRIARIISQTFRIDIDKHVVHRVWPNTIAPHPADPDLRGCRSLATPQTASGAWTCFDASRSCSEATGCSWSWTSSRVASSASACTAAPSRAPTCAACSTPPFMGAAHRDISVPIMIRCSRRIDRWTANLRILEIDEIKTIPHVPLSHPFVERLIGTMRREFLDHVPFWNSRDLDRKLMEFQVYYNAARSHASLDGRTPSTFVGENARVAADLKHVSWASHCRGLVQLPVAA